MGKHSEAALGAVHKIHNYEYASLAAAQAATWSASDVGKVFRITDEPNYYIIKTSGGEFMQIDLYDVNTISTTDATETTIATYETANDYVYYVESIVIGTVNGGGDAGAYRVEAAFKNDSGTLSQIGVNTNVDKENNSSWDVELDSSGSNIIQKVTGAAATNIDWISYTTIKVFANGA